MIITYKKPAERPKVVRCSLCGKDKSFPYSFNKGANENNFPACTECNPPEPVKVPARKLRPIEEVFFSALKAVPDEPIEEVAVQVEEPEKLPEKPFIFSYPAPLLHPMKKKAGSKVLLTEEQRETNRNKSRENSRVKSKTKEYRYKSYKSGATDRGYAFQLSFEDFCSYWQKPCAYCNSPIETIGLDRIDNKKGYSHSNVVACCTLCNMIKRNMTLKDFMNHVVKIYTNSTLIIQTLNK